MIQTRPDQPKPTLEDCADEPIHVPGSIQQHGCFLAFDEAGRVVVSSENAERFLRIPQRLVLGAPLADVLPREAFSAVQSWASNSGQNISQYLGTFLITGKLFSVVAHRIGDRRVLELELQERLVGAEMMNGVITNFVATLSKVQSSDQLCRAIVDQVAELTGFDRVMLYSFDESGAGTVLAEANHGKLPSYLNLRFPGTDIPHQARDLYVLNTVRIIPDASYTPSPLTGMDGDDVRSLDLSLSTLRSVSPIHLQYMRDMGTMSSMSLSIVTEGRLWGLISGHHATPHHVPFLIRSACDMLAKLTGTQLTAFRAAEKLENAVALHTVQRDLLTQIALQKNYVVALTRHIESLRHITNSNGIALVMDGMVWKDGLVPSEHDLLKLCEWLDTRPEICLFHSDHLASHVPWSEGVRDVFSGVLAARISDVKSRWVVWTRPEIVQTVKWAGDPSTKDHDVATLTPRTSFATRMETVRGHSKEWKEEEIQSAADFRAALVTVSLRRAEEEAEFQEARFQHLTQTLPTKIFTCDSEGELTYTNIRWNKSGLTAGGLWFDNGNVDKEDLQRIKRAWHTAIETQTEFKEELRLCETGSRPRWNFIHAVPLRHKPGSGIFGWVASCSDQTERRESEAALRMTEKLALTGRMTSVIAHEINNPLESITNLMYLLRNEVPQDGPAQTYVEMAENELHRISGITKQTLRWNRESGGTAENSSVQSMLDDVLLLFQGKIRNRQLRLHVDVDDDVNYFGISGQVRQVLANLLSNAIDAARVGGNVWIAARQTERRTTFTVRDDGVGMSESVRQQLFKPFFSTKGDLGNGLGLYISHEIVERHEGTMEVESAPDAGTTVTVSFPKRAA